MHATGKSLFVMICYLFNHFFVKLSLFRIEVRKTSSNFAPAKTNHFLLLDEILERTNGMHG